jgi:ligand-binding sensor domain-containing protein/signal transduction histidine kinase
LLNFPSRATSIALVWLFCAFLGAGFSWAQERNFRFYSSEDGLPQVQVLDMIQDEEGYLWVATYGGLGRYDGRSWKTFTVSDGLSRNSVRCLVSDGQGGIYVGTQGGGLCLFKEDEFRVFNQHPFLETSNVLDLLLDTRGRLWIAAQEGLGLLESGNFTLLNEADGLPSSFCTSLLEDRDSSIWVGTEKGAAQIQGQAVRAITGRHGIYREAIREILLDPDGQLLACTPSGVFLIQDNRYLPYMVDGQGFPYLVNRGYSDNYGNLWMATDTRGIIRISSDGLEIIDQSHGLPSNKLNAIMVDRYRNLWAATDLHLVKHSYSAFRTYTLNSGIPHDFIRAVHTAPYGDTYFGTRDGVFRINRDQELSVIDTSRFASTAIYAITHDAAGNVLFGTSVGVTRLSPSGGVENFDLSDGVSKILALYEDGEGRLWIGMQGLHYWTGKQMYSLPNNHLLGKGNVRQIMGRSDDWLWLATSKGVSAFQPETELVRTLAELEDVNVWHLAEDQDGILWAGSNGLGLMGFAKDQMVERFTKAEGLSDDTIWQVLCLPNGDKWIHTTFGINRIASNGLIQTYDRYAGLAHSEGTATAAAIGVQGNLYFGTPRGVSVFNANRDWVNNVPPPIYIKRFITDGQPLDLGSQDPLDSNLSTFLFEYASPYFIHEEKIQFRHRLVGLNESWSDPAKESQTNYVNLGPGEYTFEVEAISSDGLVSLRPAVYRFQVLPAFYETWWFRGLAIFLTLILVGLYIRLKLSQLKRANRSLEEKVQERTQELKLSNQELLTLDTIVQSINREIEFPSVLEAMLKQGMVLFKNAERSGFAVWNEEDKVFRFQASVGYDQTVLRELEFTYEELAERYASQSEIQSDLYLFKASDANWNPKPLAPGLPVPQSMLAMTLRHEERIDGFLVLDNFHDPEAFTEADVKKLSRFKEHAVSAVNKAQYLREVKEKNEELLRTKDRMVTQEKMASLGTLTAGIAHEIRNPLNFINNFSAIATDLMKELSDLFKEHRDILPQETSKEIAIVLDDLDANTRAINNHGNRASQIVLTMMDLAQPGTGQNQFIDLNALVEKFVNLAYHSHVGKNPEFEVTIKWDFDQQVGEVWGESKNLSRAITNLVKNSLESLADKVEHGSKAFQASLKVTTRSLGNEVEIEIWDNGFGIPESDQKLIFNPFFTTKPTGEGNIGMGLTICFDIIAQEHRGQLEITSQPGEWTLAKVTLPRKDR